MAFQTDAFQSDAFQGAIDAIGGAGAATFVPLIEVGAKVTLSWETDVLKMLSGLEQRIACLAAPRQRYEFKSLLSDAQHRKLLSTLAGESAAAPLFLLALAHEDLTVVSSTSASVTVHSLAFCDWAMPGQRIVVVSPAGVVGAAVVEGTAGAVIDVDTDLTAIAVEGARIMPTAGVYLEPEQALSRHRQRLGQWDLAALADPAWFTATNTVGAGATVATYDGLSVWDAGVASRVAGQPLMSGAQIVDLGSRRGAVGSYAVPDWGRALRMTGRRRADWQYLKKFLDGIRGSQKAFLLPTGRPDLVPVGDASSGTLTIVGPPGTDAPDYVNDWFPSAAHRRLKLVKTDGTFAYREVASCADNGGTQDLVLDSGLAGVLSRVEFLETARLDSDEVTVIFHGVGFEMGTSARVVQG